MGKCLRCFHFCGDARARWFQILRTLLQARLFRIEAPWSHRCRFRLYLSRVALFFLSSGGLYAKVHVAQLVSSISLRSHPGRLSIFQSRAGRKSRRTLPQDASRVGEAVGEESHTRAGREGLPRTERPKSIRRIQEEMDVPLRLCRGRFRTRLHYVPHADVHTRGEGTLLIHRRYSYNFHLHRTTHLRCAISTRGTAQRGLVSCIHRNNRLYLSISLVIWKLFEGPCSIYNDFPIE